MIQISAFHFGIIQKKEITILEALKNITLETFERVLENEKLCFHSFCWTIMDSVTNNNIVFQMLLATHGYI